MKLVLLTILMLSCSLSAKGYHEEINIENLNENSSKDNNSDLSLENLLSIKLSSGSFLDLNLENSPYSITIISSEQIKVSGATNMSELLEIYVPGFQYMYNKWNGIVWGLRGVANDRNTKIIYLINGHAINSQGRDGFNSETTLGLLSDIDKVEVLRGASGLVYGSGSISGVVNVVTKSSEDYVSDVGINYSTNSDKKVEVNIYSSSDNSQKFSFSFGAFNSDGIGEHKSRLYGYHSWPFPAYNVVNNRDDFVTIGVISDGSLGATSGNYLGSISYEYENFKFYARGTKQIFNASGMFIYDPYPDHIGSVYNNSFIEPRVVDGEVITTANRFWTQTESWNENRRQYSIENYFFDLQHKINFNRNSLQINASADFQTNRTGFEKNERYSDNIKNEFAEAFGEKRVGLKSVFNLNSIENLKMAIGSEFRYDMFGEDTYGLNIKNSNPLVPVIYDTNYYNISLFSEGNYRLNKKIAIQLGGRIDKHNHATMFNGKIASIYNLNHNNILKFVFQTASNNGSVDNYEYNRYHRDINGNIYTTPSFERPYTLPNINTDVLVAPSVDEMHSLKPEKVKTFEITTQHNLLNKIDISPSLTYGVVTDLFGWSQELYRVVNSGNYNYINLDFDSKVNLSSLKVGLMHTFQRPVFTDIENQTKTYEINKVDKDTTSNWYTTTETDEGIFYEPIVSSKDTISLNIVKSSITNDGENFLSLATHVSKLYVDYQINSMITFHTDLRIFWGLKGREELYKDDIDKYNFQYWNVWEQSIKKLNSSLHFEISEKWNLSIFANNILAIDNGINSWQQGDIVADKAGSVANTLRWQQMGESAQKGLISFDHRNFALKITRNFE